MSSNSATHSENKMYLCIQAMCSWTHTAFIVCSLPFDFNICTPPKFTYWNLIPKVTV